MNDLELLQELILAAKAEGDEETAAWLDSLDDPAEIAKVVRPVQVERGKGGEGAQSGASSSSFLKG